MLRRLTGCAGPPHQPEEEPGEATRNQQHQPGCCGGTEQTAGSVVAWGRTAAAAVVAVVAAAAAGRGDHRLTGHPAGEVDPAGIAAAEAVHSPAAAAAEEMGRAAEKGEGGVAGIVGRTPGPGKPEAVRGKVRDSAGHSYRHWPAMTSGAEAARIAGPAAAGTNHREEGDAQTAAEEAGRTRLREEHSLLAVEEEVRPIAAVAAAAERL